MAVQPIAQLFDLSGKGAVVTGGSKGIGQAVASRLAEAGAGVMITGRDADAARRAATEICSRGGKAQAIRADARSASDAENVVRATLDAFGSLDILVNNAGIYPQCPALDTPEQLWDDVLDTNLKAAFQYAQMAARAMIKAGHGGKIINIASMCADHPDLGNAPYAVSKGGLVTLTKALALEFAPHNILVNAVAPGRILTPGTQDGLAAVASNLGMNSEALLQASSSRVLLGKFGEPDDVAKVVLFLASHAADYITGSVVPVDGGYMLT